MDAEKGSSTFDLAVIGGGIAGAGIARDASLRGLSVILLEKNTYASGTSSKSSRLIHGGIRYLELAWNALRAGEFSEASKNFAFVFHSLRESRTLVRIAPDLVKPISLVIPSYRSDRRGPRMVYAGTLLYWFLAFLSGGGRFPRFYSKSKILRILPSLNPEGLLGGVRIWDHLTDDAALVRATVASAEKNGARCFEGASVTGYALNPAKKTFTLGVTGGPGNVEARKIVDATGPWVDRTRKLGGEEGSPFLQPIAGSHLMVKSFLPQSMLLQARDGRVFFVINIGAEARIGTTERVWEDPDRVEATENEIDYLLGEVKRYFPGSALTRTDILSVDAAIRPLALSSNAKSGHDASREHELHEKIKGVFHLVGVKLTDHRRAAALTVDEVVKELVSEGTAKTSRSTTAVTPL